MYGVINLKFKYLWLYSDLSVAISALFPVIPYEDDFSILPHVSNSLKILETQNYNYNVSFDNVYLPSSVKILNIAVLRNHEKDKRKINSILLDKLDEDQIDDLSDHYRIDTLEYEKKKCKLCKARFKAYEPRGYLCYYEVITLNNLESYHRMDQDETINSEIEKFDFKDIFFFNMRGRLQGLELSTVPLSDIFQSHGSTLKNGDIICCGCEKTMQDTLINIWAH
jgi:hypothetical protein